MPSIARDQIIRSIKCATKHIQKAASNINSKTNQNLSFFRGNASSKHAESVHFLRTYMYKIQNDVIYM